MADSKIKHVSDTAIWVATFRAHETKRADALFQDPLAEVLTGETGRAIANSMPFPKIMHWVMAIRTVAIDQLIHSALSKGVETIVNLGAGLDTRPYRMDLPQGLRWIEVDFPHIIEFKNEKLRDQKPHCKLERISAYFSDPIVRKKLFAQLGSDSKNILVITEGVIPYLSKEDAAALSSDLFQVPSFKFWIQDYRMGELRRGIPKRMLKKLKDAPFKFQVENWLEFFGKQGWKVGEKILAYDVAARTRRPFPFPFPWSLLTPFLPKKAREKFREASGYVTFERVD